MYPFARIGLYVFILILLLGALSPGAFAELYDATSNSFIELDSPLELPSSCRVTPGTRQHAAIWDTTHGVYLQYHPFVRYTTLVAMLADSGISMECCGTGLQTIDLSVYDVIVIAVASSWYSSYTQEEVDSLVSYYAANNQRVILTGDMNFCDNTYGGNADNYAFAYNVFSYLSETGGILIMGDNPGCPNANINPVCNAFYMTAGISEFSPSDFYFSNFSSHQIFTDISQIYYRAGGEVMCSTPAESLAWEDGGTRATVAGLDETTGIGEEAISRDDLPHFMVSPNPFVGAATISCIPHGSIAVDRIDIYDLSGRLVSSEPLRKGNTELGNALSPGMYFLKADGYRATKIIKAQ